MASQIPSESEQERDFARATAGLSVVVIVTLALAPVALVAIIVGVRWPGNAKKTASERPRA